MRNASLTKDAPSVPKRGRARDEETTSDEDDLPIKRRRRPPPRKEDVAVQYHSVVPKQQGAGLGSVGREAVHVLNGKRRFFQDLKENRVLKMALMQVDFGELERRCRCTNDGLISVIDSFFQIVFVVRSQ